MEKPTFKEWMSEPKRVMCDAYVLCTDGSEQHIKECCFDYGIQGNEIVSKKSWLIGEYFFVKSIISLSNFRKVD